MTAKEIYAQLRDDYISGRSKHERTIEQLAGNIAKLPPELRAKIDVPECELSLRGLVPECYKEVPDKKLYQEQLYRVNKLIDDWNALVEQNDMEMMECLQELNRRRS